MRIHSSISRVTVITALAASLAACGNKGDEVSVTPLLPGEECAGGGFAITVNGERSVTCHGETAPVSFETLAAGAEGNPCGGEAVKITIPQQSGEASVHWSCSAVHVDSLSPLANAAVTNYVAWYVNELVGEIYDICEGDRSPISTGKILAMVESLERSSTECYATHLTALDGYSEEISKALLCDGASYIASVHCFKEYIKEADALNVDPCSVDQPIGEEFWTSCYAEIYAEGGALEGCSDFDLDESQENELYNAYDIVDELARACH